MQTLDGKAVAEARRAQIKQDIAKFTQAQSRAPGLAVILVGDDPASRVYVGSKVKTSTELGIKSSEHRLPADITMQGLRKVIEGLNDDPAVDGILLQLPLPEPLNADQAIAWISPAKDADCLTPQNLGRLWSGRALTTPCTPWGVMAILEHYKIKTAGVNAVVVGRSNIVGKPMAHLLTQADATVTVCHSKTKDLRAHLLNADLVVVAAGKPEFLGKGDFKKGAVVIDVGIHRKEPESGGKAKLCGDVRLKELEDTVQAATPVPGGVGPMTITMLMQNTLCLARARSSAGS
ncbi:MAG TPA: bifunctional methylenetetrahydrofolate dehydrogenase/methenyltetrahydrofolate cyclohydrolase FolD [Bdellovibrionales bacterium]|nr:bifunctional methylenetetrahydrofolate dehydrogenase/methenyltetrahydrofolate cyclohydrolase FolD [Bdellovibrionales bacterium]